MRAVALIFAVFGTVAFPVNGQSLQELETKESFDHIFDLLNQAETALNTSSRLRQLDCIKAVGSSPLCKCLDGKLAVAWSFSDYVAIVTRTKEENGYDRLEPNMRAAYDNVAAVRDACVASPVAP